VTTLGAIAATPAFTQVAGSPFSVDSGGNPASATFSPDGRLLAIANTLGDGVTVLSVSAGGMLTPVGSATPTGAGTTPVSVAFSPNGQLLVTANGGSGAHSIPGSVSVFAVAADGTLTAVMGSPFSTGLGSFPSSVAVSPDSSLVATADSGLNAVSVFTVGAGGVLTQAPGPPVATGASPESVAFSPNGKLVATANQLGSSVSVFTVGNGGALTPVSGLPFSTSIEPTSLAFSPDGELLVAGSSVSNLVAAFSVASSGALAALADSPFSSGGTPEAVTFSPSGQLLAIANQAGSGNGLAVFSVSGGVIGADGLPNPVAGSTFNTGNSSLPDSVAFSPNGSLLASADAVPRVNTDATPHAVSVFVVAGPSAQVGSPAGGQTYSVGQQVPTSFSCADALYAPGLSGCADSNSATGSADVGLGSAAEGLLKTTAPGNYTYTATATSRSGQSSAASISYSVAEPPTVAISAPRVKGPYIVGQSAPTSFACTDAAFAPGISSCTDSNGTGGTPDGGFGLTGKGTLDTSTVGTHAYTVIAISRDGQRTAPSISYSVRPPLVSRSLSAASTVGDKLVLKVACENGLPSDSCHGPVEVTAHKLTQSGKLVGVAAGVIAAKPVRKQPVKASVVTLARGTYSLKAGQSSTVELTLDATGQSLLRKFYRLPATVTINGTPAIHRRVTFAYHRILSRIAYTWVFYANGTSSAEQLSVSALPARAVVTVICQGGGCPLIRRTLHPRRSRIALASLLGKRHLSAGAKFTVEVAAVNAVGKVAVFTMRDQQQPSVAILCLPPGVLRPMACTAHS
jgi:6-phosphogluconolactonase (cycloisomerase 2 family)